MVKGVLTDLDFEYEISDESLDNYDLMEILCEIDEGQTQLITKAFKLLLGEEQLKALKGIIKDKCGHVSTTEMMTAFSLIMKNTQETKK